MHDRLQLAALVAVVDQGTFDAAARALQVTPSAVSQRIKALENAAGAVLVRRSKPCTVTDSGARLLRLGRQISLLEADLLTGDDATTLPIAVNADSLATWFVPALTRLGARLSFDIRVTDEGRTRELLSDGAVLAAVSTDAAPVPGCRSIRLGALRYRALAHPSLVGNHDDPLHQAPRLRFDSDDALQRRFARRFSRRRFTGAEHSIPSSDGFHRAIRAGLGWGMVPEPLAGEFSTGPDALHDLAPGKHLDVPLHWQHWKLQTPQLESLTEAVIETAGRLLN